uniref:conjugative transposon protein TraK n=1 Tax=Pedobacter schmidteae TaxID=2201271 RepID=UPI000EB323E6|nr:conjugative transposon protein TraK [Pedobacter schmidteae]
MFKVVKDIDSAYRYMRTLSIIVIAGFATITSVIIYKCFELSNSSQGRIYVLVNGKAFEAFSSSRNENIPIEAKDHVETFHRFFFTYSPDDKAIKSNIGRALYLADNSAKKQYDDLRESNYYTSIISGNVNQTISIDSTKVDVSHYPYVFRFYGKQELTRPTSIVVRRLVTEGYLRNVTRSDNNSHGFLIERWKIVDNADISVENRN